MAIKTNNLEVTDGGIVLNGVNIFNLIYPVGSIYISVNNTNPYTLFGIGTWDLLPEGYALWTTTSDNTGGSKISAGLPNITGHMNNAVSDQVSGATGAFVPSKGSIGFTGGSINWYSLDFDANKGASVKGIYGNSNTVQPPSIRVYVWKRTA